MAPRLALAAVAALGLAAPAAAREPSPAALRRAIDRIVGRPQFASSLFSVEVRGLRSGRVLYSRDAHKSVQPASALKIVTTAAALDALGPEARLKTTVETAGRLDALGRILGDVYLVGGGDTSLSGRYTDGRITAALEGLAEGLRAAGVRHVEGRVVGHEGLFHGERRGRDWSWGDLVWWYGAEVSALSFNDNAADLRVTPGERVGDPALVERNPVSAHYSVVSTVATTPAGSQPDLTLRRDLGSNVIRLSGSVPLGAEPWVGAVAVEDPARYTATVFTEILAAKGIRVAGAVATSSDPLPPGMRVLATYEGPPIAELLKAVNKPSHNLHAEMMLRLVGARVKGQGSVEAGQAAVDEFLRRLGVAPEAWDLQDGSGLSRADLVTARGLAALLAAMDRHPHARVFVESLPVAGVDGTLKNRMRGQPAEGRVAAKTGTLRQTNALAGYVTTRDGDRLAFAIVVNHQTAGSAVAAMDEICNLLVTLR